MESTAPVVIPLPSSGKIRVKAVVSASDPQRVTLSAAGAFRRVWRGNGIDNQIGKEVFTIGEDINDTRLTIEIEHKDGNRDFRPEKKRISHSRDHLGELWVIKGEDRIYHDTIDWDDTIVTVQWRYDEAGAAASAGGGGTKPAV